MDTNEHEFINDEARMSNEEDRSLRITRIDAKEKSRKEIIRVTSRDSGKPGFSASFVFIRVDSWLRSKSQHFDRGRDFDVLVAHDEI